MNTNFRHSLGTSVILSSSIFVIIVCLSMGFLGFNTYSDAMIKKYQQYIAGILKTTSSEIDGDDLAKCIKDGKESKTFTKTRIFLDKCKVNYDIKYIYMITPVNKNKKDNMKYVMVGTTEDEIKNGIKVNLGDLSGTEYSPKVVEYYMQAMKNKKGEIKYYKNTTSFGYMYTGIIPIYDSEGNAITTLSVDIEMTEWHKTRLFFLRASITGGIVLVIIFVVLMNFWFKRRVVTPIARLEKSARHYVKSSHGSVDPGSLVFKIPKIDTHDEIQSLGESLYTMSEDLKLYMTNLMNETKDKERIASELNIANHIQLGMLPSIFPPFPDRDEFDLFGSMKPAKEVGGDFYDFYLIDENHLGLVIADVSGKGVPAALFMVISKTLIKNQTSYSLSPKDILEKVNSQLCENNEVEMFVTVWLGILEISTGKLTCANAGHEYPAIKRKGEPFELYKDKHGLVVAAMDGIKYKEYELELNPGDTLYLYTDGVPEATSNDNELFGTDRMVDALNKWDDKEMLNSLFIGVTEDINEFIQDAPQFDDMTMLAMKYHGPKGR
ncbi:MAG: SpoIIE family protein phosphatase [Lachnospiraceae bacterium]|nr:SpoIIE family protein phosphatase [Lachnospiraceae bacterium]